MGTSGIYRHIKLLDKNEFTNRDWKERVGTAWKMEHVAGGHSVHTQVCTCMYSVRTYIYVAQSYGVE
jgi:hypothetical protein